ncbi:10745_t:CDS:2 [Gigaspora margarita]|uniref:10745_t:CDS:1 n=1 Tax=Gigaspora margarita TaxID=4874 RepID=A0ABN7UL73_GIGMA|nr:10745_t:CDS:2 [Gigaspora margarita]
MTRVSRISSRIKPILYPNLVRCEDCTTGKKFLKIISKLYLLMTSVGKCTERKYEKMESQENKNL